MEDSVDTNQELAGVAVESPHSAQLTCPFCHEEDFDAVGLKSHLSYGHCDVFNNTELAARPPW